MKISIIGAGPAGLAAAEKLAKDHEIHLYEGGKAIGRKFLLAGKGGFNLTNQATGEELINKYHPPQLLRQALTHFDSEATRDWLKELGVATFVGSSGRIFPEKGIKPIEVLQLWEKRLEDLGVHFHLQHQFVGFTKEGVPKIKNQEKIVTLDSDKYIFALGGASWPVTGSKGDWLEHFEKLGVPTLPFQASNCGIEIDWPQSIRQTHLGKPLKNCRFNYGDKRQSGEVVITDYGLEGNGIYPLVPLLRHALKKGKRPHLSIDLKPQNKVDQLLEKLGNKSTKKYAKTLHLDAALMALVKTYMDKKTFLSTPDFVAGIKQLRIPVKGLRPIDEAISSTGGIALEAIREDFSLKQFPAIHIIGEMLDWDAPTGGFLLQACFSMGRWLLGDPKTQP